MPRSLSPTAVRALNSQYSAEAFVDLVTLTSPEMPIPLRLANSAVDITSRGHVFTRSVLDVARPDSTGDKPPTATISLLNIDRTITDAIRPLTRPIDVTIECVRLADTDTVEQAISGLFIFGLTCTETTVQAGLGIEDPRTKRAPAHAFVWSNFPGIR